MAIQKNCLNEKVLHMLKQMGKNIFVEIQCLPCIFSSLNMLVFSLYDHKTATDLICINLLPTIDILK